MNTPMTRSRYLAFTLTPPILAAIAALVWALSVKSQLPDPIATHFTGIPMRADGYDSFAAIYMLPAIAVAMCGIQLFAVFGNASGGQARFLTGFGATSSFLMTALIPGTLWPQVGLESAEGIVIPGSVAAALFGLPLLGGIALALITPPPSTSKDSETPDTSTLNLAPGTNAVWFGQARASKKLAVFMWLIALLTPAFVVPIIFAAYDSLIIQILMSVIVLVPIVVVPMFLGVKVRVDAQGVHWQSTLGIPRGSIAYADIKTVEATTIEPGSWGGWGWRIGAQGQAMLVRGGEGLHIARTNGRNFYITVDDAKTGARAIREHLQK
ncbi:DUF1648 domain-containing protein [Corynebacterium ulceribovis]|uniref:DUF1648 domain-containing protein n=1 Tax=Corynebacterium ulceribovis TaxID=487732 RepID=UPI0003688453|nr:DUF1648 domain-containing protein [Corynebacterium ulceribovis]